MTSRRITAAEARRILALPSPLMPETRKVLIEMATTGAGERMIRENEAEDRETLRAIREWLGSRAHVAWCRCAECRQSEAAQ